MTADWADFEEKLLARAEESGIPLVGQFELTARCNLQCRMCYVCEPSDDKYVLENERSAAEWIGLMEQARNAGMLYVLLTGGEVFVRPDFKDIYEEISRMGLQTTIYTNGTLITPEIARWLGRIPPSRMEVTLYGASAGTYGRVAGHPEAFGQAIKGIDLLLGEGINVKLRTTVVNDNKADFDKLNELADSRDLLMHYCFYISPRRDEDGRMRGGIRLDPCELATYEHKAGAEYSRRVDEKIRKYGTPGKSDAAEERDERTDAYGRCSAARSEFWITWDGRMTPCGGLGEPWADPFESGFLKAWETVKDKFGAIIMCSECIGCSLRDICWTCKARLKSETGRFDMPAPYLCEWAIKRKNLFIEE